MDEDGPGGGSRALADELDSFGGLILSDFRDIGVDLLDLFRDDRELSPRVALQLLFGLPYGSRYRAEKRGGQQFYGWDEDRYVEVDIANSLRSLVWLYSQTHSKKNLSRPKPIPIPGGEKKQKPDNPNGFTAFVDRAKKRHEQLEAEE